MSLRYTDEPSDTCVTDAWDRLASAGAALGDGQELVWADGDGDDLPEGWALRLLAEARCADPAVEAAWDANLSRCTSLGWGGDWAELCAGYGTLSDEGVSLMNAWNGRPIGLAPFRSGGEEPLSAVGDFDLDGASNLEEFTTNGGAEGSAASFARQAAGG